MKFSSPQLNFWGQMQHWLPGLQLLNRSNRASLRADVLAGATVCVVMIPSVIAYAGLIGVPPQYGLYAALIPLLIYPWFTTSRQVIVGPDIAISLLMAGAIAPLAGGDPMHTAALASLTALISGLFLLVGAKAKIGMVADFFSKPVLVGYMTGAALILMASQLNKLFGIPLHHSEFLPRLLELSGSLHQFHGPTLILGGSLLTLLIVLRRFAPKIPAALTVCVVALLASTTLHLQQRGVPVVGALPKGLPAFQWPQVSWSEVQSLLPACLGIALLTYTEGILLARAFAARNGYEINCNQELGALGLADLATGLFQGFAITGSQARTTINNATGGKTQLTSLVAAATLGLFLLFLTPWIAQLPEVALAAILVYGGFTLVEFDVMKRIYRLYPLSGLLAAGTTLGVLAVGVVPGILIGVALSLLGLINRISRPPDAVLSEVPGKGFHDLGVNTTGQTLPGLIVYRFYGPLLFSNASHFVERVRTLIAAAPSPVRWFLLDAQAITELDVTAAETLHFLNQELRQKGVALKIAHANRPLRQNLARIGFTHELNKKNFFESVHECVELFRLASGTLHPHQPPKKQD